MSVATLRYDARAIGGLPAALQRASGEAELVFGRRGDASVLRHLYQRTPCRVLFPQGEPDEPPVAVLLTTSGGLTGGDTLRLDVTVEAGASATVTSQAAEKLYRSLGPDTRIAVALKVRASGRLDYLPQETILFDGARLDRRSRVDLDADARFLGCEMVVFGRAAHNERLTRGRFFDRWQIRRDGKLVWADALSLEGDIEEALDAPFGFAGAGAFATALYVGPDAVDLLPVARGAVERLPRGGVSLLGDVIVARFLDPAAQLVRSALGAYLSSLRAATSMPAALPKAWQL